MSCNNQTGVVNIQNLPIESDLTKVDSVLAFGTDGSIVKIPSTLFDIDIRDLAFSNDTAGDLMLNKTFSNNITTQIQVPNATTSTAGVMSSQDYTTFTNNTQQILNNTTQINTNTGDISGIKSDITSINSQVSTNTNNISTNTNNIYTNQTDISTLKSKVSALEAIGGKWIGKTFATYADLQAEPVSSSWNNGDFAYIQADETQDNKTTLYFWENGQWVFGLIVDTIITSQFDRLQALTIVADISKSLDSTAGIYLNATIETYDTSSNTWSESTKQILIPMADGSTPGIMQPAFYNAFWNYKYIASATNSLLGFETSPTNYTIHYSQYMPYAATEVDQTLIIPGASSSNAGVMSVSDKQKLDGINPVILQNFYIQNGTITAVYNATPSVVKIQFLDGTPIDGVMQIGQTTTFTPNGVLDIFKPFIFIAY